MKIQFRGLENYSTTWQAMREFTDTRNENTEDEIWILEHSPVYTQGQAGKSEHLIKANDIPLVQSDRGGQITYHGPGQLIAYFLLDLRRAKVGPRQLVTHIEDMIIQILADYKITARSRADAPGVYVEDAKICSLGLRIRKGCSYHGLAFNIDMDLGPFLNINPCGVKDLKVTQLKDLELQVSMAEVISKLCYYSHSNFK